MRMRRKKLKTNKHRIKKKMSQRNLLFILLSNPRIIAVCATGMGSADPLFSQLEHCV